MSEDSEEGSSKSATPTLAKSLASPRDRDAKHSDTERSIGADAVICAHGRTPLLIAGAVTVKEGENYGGRFARFGGGGGREGEGEGEGRGSTRTSPLPFDVVSSGKGDEWDVFESWGKWEEGTGVEGGDGERRGEGNSLMDVNSRGGKGDGVGEQQEQHRLNRQEGADEDEGGLASVWNSYTTRPPPAPPLPSPPLDRKGAAETKGRISPSS